MGDRKLAGRVSVAGRWYGPGDDIPDDVAEKITNPKLWAPAGGADTEEVTTVKAGTPTGARLARQVQVGGRWYGPDDEVPADIAAQIRNPKAWQGGKLPSDTEAVTANPAEGQEPVTDSSGDLAGGGDGLVAGDTGPDPKARKSTAPKKS